MFGETVDFRESINFIIVETHNHRDVKGSAGRSGEKRFSSCFADAPSSAFTQHKILRKPQIFTQREEKIH